MKRLWQDTRWRPLLALSVGVPLGLWSWWAEDTPIPGLAMGVYLAVLLFVGNWILRRVRTEAAFRWVWAALFLTAMAGGRVVLLLASGGSPGRLELYYLAGAAIGVALIAPFKDVTEEMKRYRQ